ncbi:tetratricopeptide repeat (TPR)-like superfamily protein [Wolffia australiana]
MLSLRTIRRLCAAADAVALAAIAAGLSRPKFKSHFVASSGSSAPPPSDPAPTDQAGSEPDQDQRPVFSEPALVRLKKERDPEELFRIFQANAQNRLVVENRFAFEDTVARLAGARRGDLIEQLLDQQMALPQGRREGFATRIITLYGKAGMPAHARRAFDEMPGRRTVLSFNATLRVLCRSRDLSSVQSFLVSARSNLGIRLDEISYNTLIKGLCEAGSLESAYSLMADMEREKLKPDVVTYTTLMAAAYKRGRREVGDGLWNLMVLRGCLPNAAAFNARIQHLVSRNRAWQARGLMKKMTAVGVRPDQLTFNLVIKGLCRAGEMEMAKRTFLAMRDAGCEPSMKIYQTMVHYLCLAEQFELAFRLCRDSMSRGWFPSVASVRSLLGGLSSISKEDCAEEIVRLVRARASPCAAGEPEALQSAASPDGKR